MITFSPNPLPLIIKETKEEAYLLYVESGGQFENDIWTIVKCDGGEVIHVNTSQVLVYKNKTFDIKPKPL